ncbi:polysaccharide deacetylase family protein [Halalkalibacter lacteus]|uniref:polysaccharide deacetylase family protein n=1 Tax=Halalkalibacter lacteus TaxID=3090663 RepID=UPI003D6659E7
MITTLHKLEILKEKAVPANFFVVGKEVEAFPMIIDELQGQGVSVCYSADTIRKSEKLNEPSREAAIIGGFSFLFQRQYISQEMIPFTKI